MLDQTMFDVPKMCPTSRNADTSAARVVMPDTNTDISIWFRKGGCRVSGR